MIGRERMRRREVLELLGRAAVLAPLTASAQEPGRIYRLGGLHQAPKDAPHHIALRQELRQLGYVEGQNLDVDGQGYGLRLEQFVAHAAEVADARVDVILAGGDPGVRAAMGATKTIPILALTDDMVGQGFVRSLAKPGGNVTGVSILASELDGKRQEILLLAMPGVRRLAALADVNTTRPGQLQALQDGARARSIELSIHRVTQADEIKAAIDAAKKSGAEALNVLASALLFNNRQIVLERAVAHRLPAVYQWPEIPEQGGLIGYGPSIVQLYRDVMARQLVRLLRGTMPADVPVEQPTKFELVINLKTAKVLGLTIPPSALARADRVIE
jgi:putative ABC transport system substrate-binding protein